MNEKVWGPVLYNNVLSLGPTMLLGLSMGEFSEENAVARPYEWTSPGIATVALSCAIGIGISHAGFNCRSLVSATSFTIVGVMNKMVTVLVNLLIWDKVRRQRLPGRPRRAGPPRCRLANLTPRRCSTRRRPGC